MAAVSAATVGASMLVGTGFRAAPATAQPADSPIQASTSAALRQARSTGHQVEIGALRGESREVYAQPDGTFEAVQHLIPVRTRQDGRWVKIDTTLTRTPDGSVAPKAASVGLRFSGGGDAPMAIMDRAGRSLSLSWTGRLPAPVLVGSTATYPDVLPGVDLRLRADVDGFSHVLVVKTRQAAHNPKLARLTLPLASQGLSVQQDSAGGLRAVDTGGGGAVFEAARPTMWDSPGTSPAARATVRAQAADLADEPTEAAVRAPVGLQLSGQAVTLVPDQAMLSDPATTFPVYIDPVYKTVTESARLMVSSGGWEKYGFTGDEGMGLCPYSYTYDCGTHHVKRLFYRMPTTGFGGKTIISAEFQIQETFAPSCTTRSVQLWKTKAFGSSSTWNSTSDNWLEFLDSRDVAKGYTGCAVGDVIFDATTGMKEAAAGGWSTLTLGLRARDEGDQLAWKRFDKDASLRVHYNTPPAQPPMSKLWSSPGGACVSPSSAVRVNSMPTAHATLTDPDNDKVYADFVAFWDDAAGHHEWHPAKVGPYSSGSDFKITLPSTVPEGIVAGWSVRAYDGMSYGPWSYTGSATGCYFIYDRTAPPTPAITSPAYDSGGYPPSNANDENDPWYAGLGRYGTFTFSSTATDVVKYTYGILGDPAGFHDVTTTGGAARTVEVMPSSVGLNVLQVTAVDGAGNRSVGTYSFRVSAGSVPKATYPLDEPIDSTQVSDSSGGNAATVHGGAVLGVDGMSATAMQLNGTSGYASTAAPLLDTTKSFAVSAWARLAATKPDHACIVATQAGAQRSGFELYYSASYDRWVFNRYAADTTDAAIVRSLSTAAPQGGEWAQLLGVYDSVAKTLTLYVNGVRQQSVAYTTPWNATGGLQIGAGSYEAAPGSFFAGDVDNVQIFDRVVTDQEAQDLFTQHPVVAGRWKLNEAAATVRASKAYWKMDEASTATRAEDSQGAYPAGIHGGATFGTTGKVGKAMHLNGSTAYAATSGPVVDTTASFSVSSWVRMTVKPTSGAPVVISQEGSVGSAFALYYSSSSDRWVFNMQPPDSNTPTYIRASSTAPPTVNAWTHLTGVYDATAQRIRLYVNGVLQQSTDQPNSYAAAGPVDLGRFKSKGSWTGYFTGDLDDVHVFDQAVTDSEVALLAGASSAAATTADDSVAGHHATLAGNAYVDQGGGWVGTGALALDGDGDYAATGGPVLDTSRSFTVAGWVQTAGRPNRAAAIFSQEGAVNSGFTVRYAPDPNDPASAGGYQIDMPDQDTSTANHQTAQHTSYQAVGDWDHVAIVYDAFSDQMRLYVNGVMEQSENVSYRSNTLGFSATGAFQLGRTKTNSTYGEYWPGLIDDVWAFDGVATDEQIEQLANGVELPTSQ
jgi:hypothetical protein